MDETAIDGMKRPSGEGLVLVLPGRRCALGAAWRWIAVGLRLFARAPLMWIIAFVLLFLAAILVNIVPVVGGLAFQVLQAVIAAGMMVACRSLETGGEFELEHLLAGFTQRFVPLLVVGALLMAGGLAILVVMMSFGGFSLIGVAMGGDPVAFREAVERSSDMLALGGLVGTALLVPLLAAYWFAPALVVMHPIGPLAAMKASFFACFRNFWTFALYGVFMLVLAIVASIPILLGFLVWFPLAVTSTYAAYRDIFTEEELEPAAAAP